jgi:hypothetical protein
LRRTHLNNFSFSVANAINLLNHVDNQDERSFSLQMSGEEGREERGREVESDMREKGRT